MIPINFAFGVGWGTVHKLIAVILVLSHPFSQALSHVSHTQTGANMIPKEI